MGVSGYQLESENLNSAFLEIIRIVQPLGCVPFFGTLLGLGRSGSLISGDDDIDFACRLENLETATQKLKSAFSVLMVLDTLEPEFGAGTRTLVFEYESSLIHLDLYCPVESGGVSLFPCHWFDSRQNEQTWLRVPSPMIHNLQMEDFSALGTPMVSLQPLASYLYGPTWRTPSRKNIDHIHTLVNGVPYVRKTSSLERIRGSIKLFYSNFYWRLKLRLLRVDSSGTES
jgi:hypothetical protein